MLEPNNTVLKGDDDDVWIRDGELHGHCSQAGVNVSALPGQALEGRTTGAYFECASAAACLLACCGNASCNAFTFNSWQPGPRPKTDACPTGARCCWLKEKAPAGLVAQRMINATSAIVRHGAAPAPAPSPSGPLTLPTPSQLSWARGGKFGISALVHFNMATFAKNRISASSPAHTCMENTWGDLSDPATFAPSAYDPADWASAMQLLGIEEAVLTAKHGCGVLHF